jgi:acyl-coenzyme A thioesterase PaaI-like protein
VIIDMKQNKLKKYQAQVHSHCRLCGQLNQNGFKLEFVTCEDGSVETEFACVREFMGYENHLHGGVIASLLDSAMTNCLFAQGKVAVTAELKVRYRKSVDINEKAVVRAWIDESLSKLYVLKAELLQNKIVKVTAIGKFMDQPNLYNVGN